MDSTCEPSWKPDITVVGVGETGSKTLDHLSTTTSVSFVTDPRPEQLSPDLDFLFLSADVTEPQVSVEVQSLAGQTDDTVVLFAEGSATPEEKLQEEVDLVVPIRLDSFPREIYATFIADLFEAMLPMTLQELGKGDLQAVIGETRIGKLYIETLADDGGSVDLTPAVAYESVESSLFFYCGGDEQPPNTIQRQIEDSEIPEDAPVIRDQRVQPRYVGNPHIKYLLTAPAGDSVTWDS